MSARYEALRGVVQAYLDGRITAQDCDSYHADLEDSGMERFRDSDPKFYALHVRVYCHFARIDMFPDILPVEKANLAAFIGRTEKIAQTFNLSPQSQAFDSGTIITIQN